MLYLLQSAFHLLQLSQLQIYHQLNQLQLLSQKFKTTQITLLLRLLLFLSLYFLLQHLPLLPSLSDVNLELVGLQESGGKLEIQHQPFQMILLMTS
jgi:hypothetical protein